MFSTIRDRVAILCVAATFTMSAQDMSNSIEYGQLYIVGDATEKGWDIGNADGFRKISAGVFEWTGKLEAGKDFKFMNTRDWYKHVVAVDDNVTAEENTLYPLAFYAAWDMGDRDRKFKVAETKDYTIVVDLNAMRMKVGEPEAMAEFPSRFYLTGSAVGEESVGLSESGGVEYKGVVHLLPGRVKLADTPAETAETRYFGPRFADVDISFGAGFHNTLVESAKDGGNGWTVTVEGDYALYIDKNAKTYTFKRFTPAKVLYLVGGCCRKPWNYWDADSDRFYPDPDNTEVLVWEGELRVGWDEAVSGKKPDEPAKFKILTAQDWFRDTYHPYVPDAAAEGASGARISGGDDLKWTISRDGFYRLELDTRAETLRGTYLGASHLQADDVSQAGVDDVAIAGCAPDGGPVEYYNLQGVRMPRAENGICIVKRGNSVTKMMAR